MTLKRTYPVTRRAIIARINRALALHGMRLFANRSKNNDLGRYYTVDIAGGNIASKAVTLSDIASELALLKPWERVEEDE